MSRISVADTITQTELGVHVQLNGNKGEVTYGMSPSVLQWIQNTVQPGWRTVETGCGHSTAAFAAAGAEHIAISPFADEWVRVADWCRGHDIDTRRVVHIAERSDLALPSLTGEYDLGLIDGSHSFPHVFIDFWYIALRLKVGGLLVVDDVMIWTGHVLNEFLAAEPGWELVEEWHGRTVAFRKTAPTDPMKTWNRQPYLLKRLLERREFQSAVTQRTRPHQRGDEDFAED